MCFSINYKFWSFEVRYYSINNTYNFYVFGIFLVLHI